MTTELNREGDHLSSADPSRWVVRYNYAVVSHHPTSKAAARWLRDYTGDSLVAAVQRDWLISKSYTVTARYWDRSKKPIEAFPAEFQAERMTFSGAMDALGGWIHRSWEQDRDNHPSNAGRQMAWERWHDVLALTNIASLTLIPNPGFKYAFGPLSPPEGKGHDLRLVVAPTPSAILDSMVRRNV